jgi:hypothetical protein
MREASKIPSKKAETMTGYELSRQWFDFSFENPDKINPNHVALFFFAVEHNNRLGWRDKFGLPTCMAMEAIGIKNFKTYAKAFNDLVEWGFFHVHQKSRNQYSATVIALVKNTEPNTGAFTKASKKHDQKQVQSIVDINKPINIEHSNNTIKEKFEEFRKSYPGKKRGFEPEFENFIKKQKGKAELVIDLLIPALNDEIDYREQRIKSSEFVPEWKNLQTWINQQCWTQEFPTKQPKQHSHEIQSLPTKPDNW